MIKQNVHIVNFNILYEILEEIKENLSFNIHKYEDEVDYNNNNKSDDKNFLVITSPAKKKIKNKKFINY